MRFKPIGFTKSESERTQMIRKQQPPGLKHMALASTVAISAGVLTITPAAAQNQQMEQKLMAIKQLLQVYDTNVLSTQRVNQSSCRNLRNS